MPSQRRLRTSGILLVLAVFIILYLTNDSRRASTQDFYETTVDALNAEDAANAETARRLKEARQAAKKGAKPEAVGPIEPEGHQAQLPIDIEIPKRDDGHTSAENPFSGRTKIKGGEKWDMATGKEAALQAHAEGEHAGQKKQETQEEHDIEVELNAILKKGPIIVFSKSHCPFSAKAKHILLDKYIIVPAPHVVELDQHPLGSGLQAALAKSTGRRTVPNVLINGKSIGGGDDVEALDVDGSLIEKVRSMAGRRIMEAKLAR